jgi:hypothetical protein
LQSTWKKTRTHSARKTAHGAVPAHRRLAVQDNRKGPRADETDLEHFFGISDEEDVVYSPQAIIEATSPADRGAAPAAPNNLEDKVARLEAELKSDEDSHQTPAQADALLRQEQIMAIQREYVNANEFAFSHLKEQLPLVVPQIVLSCGQIMGDSSSEIVNKWTLETPHATSGEYTSMGNYQMHGSQDHYSLAHSERSSQGGSCQGHSACPYWE